MSDFPRRFGPYVLLKPLARGGMGALYLALSGPEESAKLCVIKTVLPHLADKEYLQRFRDEAKVVVRLSHGNLVPVFDSGQVAGEIYLAMDFVEGKDLRATWNRCAKKGIAFPVDVAAHIVKELARGLHYAHGFGDIKLVHRDVSPPNVLLSYSGEVRLTDFGLASSTLKLEKTAPGIIYGKVSYMSPEQARGETLDGRTDLYAAGIILWELLTGRQLFPSGKAPGAPKDAQSAEELLRRVRSPELIPPSRRASRVPPELDRIALKALAPDLKQRYSTCEELRHDLQTYLAQTSPATDAARVSAFLKELYAEDIATERTEREDLILKAREWYSSGIQGRAILQDKAVPPPLPSAATKPKAGEDGAKSTAKPADKSATTVSENGPATGRGDRRDRAERGTVVAGPAPHDHSLDKKITARETGDVLLDSQAGGDASAAVVGTVVGGRYYVRRLCGEGGMGRVYEAEHIDIGRRVALKILHPAFSQTPDLVERLRREARAASKISHPNVVDVTDSGTTPDGAFFFVMEYLEGIELGELIYREGRLDVRRTLHIGTQICRALQAAHEVNVIHRDLKPENVLILTRDGQKDFVKVLDFGIAKSGDSDVETESKGPRRLTHPGMTMGTPEYMAPEQAAGRPADPRSDVYAVGGLLYEMLSGNAPYEGSNFMEILHKKANSLPAPLSGIRSDVPPQLEAIITKTMAKDPDNRPRSMDELGRELQSLAMGMFSGFGTIPPPGDASEMVPVGIFGAALREAAVQTGLFKKMQKVGRRQLLIGAGVSLVVLVSAILLGAAVARRGRSGPEVSPVVAVAPPAARPTPPVAPAPPAEPAKAEPAKEESVAEEETTKAGEEESVEAEEVGSAKAADGEGGKAKAGSRTGTGGSSGTVVDSKKLLVEGERFLRAERFAEAREIFLKLSRSRATRGPALVGLAEIAFQEKKYAEAAQTASMAADRGGGVKARVLLGDAHFRLAQYKAAAKAYEEALKLDPTNASAKSGLALATKRM